MRARLVDPKGPLWTRLVPSAGAALLIGASLFFAGPGDTLITTALLLMGMGITIGRTLLGKHSPRWAEIALGPGFVDVKGAGLLNQRIRGRRVKGASTAYVARGGVGLVLQRRDRPIALELRDDDDANAVRDALGIGHHGFGKVGWRTMAYAQLKRWLPIALCTIAILLIHSPEEFYPLFFMAAPIMVSSLIIAATSHEKARTQPAGIQLEPRGVILREPRCEIPYRAILDVKATKDGISIMVDPRFHDGRIETRTRGSLTDDERAHCIAQITSAVRRARGLGPREPLVSGQVEDLARGAEDTRAWLLRLDAMAQQMMSGAGYRGLAVDSTELWAALENHEADVHVRAAAARVLARTDQQSRKRIQTIARSARDKQTERRIRIVLDPDVDHACSELDELAKPPRTVIINYS